MAVDCAALACNLYSFVCQPCLMYYPPVPNVAQLMKGCLYGDQSKPCAMRINLCAGFSETASRNIDLHLRVTRRTVAQLWRHNVHLEGCLLKPQMVVPGKLPGIEPYYYVATAFQ